MFRSPRPAPVHPALHLLRMLGWLVVLEFFGGVLLSPGEASEGYLIWLVGAAGAAAALALALGGLAGLSGWLRSRPEPVIGLAWLALVGVSLAVDGSLLLAPLFAICGLLAWVRWRFPGEPGRGRTVFRWVFFTALIVGLVGAGLRTRRPWRFSEAEVVGTHSVLLVVLDTVRRDHLSTYGYPRDTSPNLDALATQGISYRAWANGCWSLPGHGTVLTGRYAGAHGAHYEGWALAEGERTIARAFEQAGYDTLLVSGNPWLQVENGLASDFGGLVEAFGHYVTPNAFLLLRAARPLWDWDRDKGGAAGARALGRWLDARPDPQRPFFAMVNVMEAHAPYHQVPVEDLERYLPGGFGQADAVALSEELLALHLVGGQPPSGSDAERAVDIYDGAVRGADRVLGQLLDQLRRRGLEERVLVVVTADHGEFLGERGLWGHVHGLYEPVLTVPLVLAGPGQPRGVCSAATARLIDVAPTVLDAAGVPQSLWPLVHGRVLGQGSPEAPVLAEQYVPTLLNASGEPPSGDLGDFAVRRFALLEGGQELHVVGEEGTVVDWRVDPEVSPTTPDDAVRRLFSLRVAAGARWEQDPEASDQPGLDAFSREALRALGYLGAD
jgi:arylsulfatase A-like enzyme